MNRTMHELLFSDRSAYPSVMLRTPLATLSWVTGGSLTERVERLDFELTAPTGFAWPDYIRPAANIPLFSAAMRRALEQAGIDNVEYVDAAVTDLGSGARRMYFAANVVGLVAAMDRRRSSFELLEGAEAAVERIDRLALDPRRCGEHRLFRLAEFDLLIVVDGAVGDALRRAALAAVVLTPPEDWDGFTT